MFNYDTYQNVTYIIAAIISATGGIFMAVRHAFRDNKKTKEAQACEILGKASEETNLVRIQLEARIEAIEMELKNLESSVKKDLGHIQEIYTSEIAGLANKIENLRDELRTQHVDLLNLITKLIDRR